MGSSPIIYPINKVLYFSKLQNLQFSHNKKMIFKNLKNLFNLKFLFFFILIKNYYFLFMKTNYTITSINFKCLNIKFNILSSINNFFFSSKQLTLKTLNQSTETNKKEIFFKNLKFLKFSFLFLFKILENFNKKNNNNINKFCYYLFILNYKNFFFFFNIFYFFNFICKNLKINFLNYNQLFFFWYPRINFLKKKKKKSIKKRLKKNFISSIKIY